jgi:hypothetical protein
MNLPSQPATNLANTSALAATPLPVPAKFDWRAYLLGTFVLIHIGFLLAMNAVQLFKREVVPDRGEVLYSTQAQGRAFESNALQIPLEKLGQACEFWEGATGCWQGWSMFAPYFPQSSVYPVIVLEWDEATPSVELNSIYRPKDVYSFFYLTDHTHRYFNYESKFAALFGLLPIFTDELSQLAVKRVIDTHNTRTIRSKRAYLAFRVQQFLLEHPGTPYPNKIHLIAEKWDCPKPGVAEIPKMERIPICTWEPTTDTLSRFDNETATWQVLPDYETGAIR